MTNDHEKQYKRMIELWFECLQMNDGYALACESGRVDKYAKVHRVFGDVRGVDFEDLWRDRKDCFQRISWEAEALRSGDDGDSRIDNADELVVVVNLYAPVRDIEKKFREILKEAKEKWTPKDSASAEKNGHVYADLKITNAGIRQELGTRIRTLERVLKVYKRSLEADTHDMHRYELGADVNLSASQRNISDEVGQKGKKARRSLSSRACQDIKRAKELIHYAALGVFPAPGDD